MFQFTLVLESEAFPSFSRQQLGSILSCPGNRQSSLILHKVRVTATHYQHLPSDQPYSEASVYPMDLPVHQPTTAHHTNGFNYFGPRSRGCGPRPASLCQVAASDPLFKFLSFSTSNSNDGIALADEWAAGPFTVLGLPLLNINSNSA